jgi:arsenical-resistance protein 2
MTLALKIASILLIDVRDEAIYPQGGTIRGSLHIPAKGFWWNRGILYELAFKADVEWVCFVGLDGEEDTGGEDESVGDDGAEDGGMRLSSKAEICAGWFLDHVRGTVGDGDMQILVLEGDLEEWVNGGRAFVGLMDGFEREVWEERRKRRGESGMVKKAEIVEERKMEEEQRKEEEKEEDKVEGKKVESQEKKRKFSGDEEDVDGGGSGNGDGDREDSTADVGVDAAIDSERASSNKKRKIISSGEDGGAEAPPEAAEAVLEQGRADNLNLLQ